MKSRSKSAAANIIAGLVVHIAILVLSFIGRRIFIRYLSVEYLGINGLYSNVLSVLSLAELGLGSVIQFFLYRPVLMRDEAQIASLLKYFRRLYSYIALAVLTLGLLLIPFLKYIVNSELSNSDLIVYYIVFLLNSVVSYFAADKIALYAANQDNRVHRYITLLTSFLSQLIHIVVLIVWRDFLIYSIATLLSTIVNVVLINYFCNKRYPFLRTADQNENIDRKGIFSNVKATFFYKIGATVVNNTSNILISIMISTAAVGIYSNYYMIVAALQGFLAIVTTSLVSGIGNLSAEGNKTRMISMFNLLLLFFHFIAAFGGILLFLLFRRVITLWLGPDYLLDDFSVFAIAFGFYSSNAISPVWMFRESNGIFSKVKYLWLITAAVNIVLSIGLGSLWGMFGILIATSVSRILTQVWYEPKVLYQHAFNTNSSSYWSRQIKYVVLTALCGIICYFISSILPSGTVFVLVEIILVFLVCVIAFWIAAKFDPEYASIKEYLSILMKNFRKVTN